MEHPLLKLLSETDKNSDLYQEIIILYLRDELINLPSVNAFSDSSTFDAYFEYDKNTKFYLCKYDGDNVLDYFTNTVQFYPQHKRFVPTIINKKYSLVIGYDTFYIIK
jgi:hypothetical protein